MLKKRHDQLTAIQIAQKLKIDQSRFMWNKHTRIIQKALLWTAFHTQEKCMLNWFFYINILHSILHVHVKFRRNQAKMFAILIQD